jgi:hypothetical protein
LRILFFLLINFLPTITLANMKDPFVVRFLARVHNLATTQAQADLSMARDVRYCRGAMMPKPQGPWSCETVQNMNRCERTYVCARIHQNFNRLTETKRLVAVVRSNPAQRAPSFSVSPPPPALVESRVKPPDDMRMVESEVERPVLEKAPELRKTTRATPQATQSGRSNLVTGEVDLDEAIYDEDDQELMAMLEEVAPRAEQPFSEEFLSAFSWASFMLSMNSISNQFDSALTTVNFAWTPRYHFSSAQWSVRAHLGGHLYEPSVDDNPESFIVLETLGLAQYRLNNYFLLEAGLGQQYWNVDAGSSFFTWSLGAALSPVRPWFSFIDRLGLSYQSISNEESSREFRLSLGVSF